MARARRPPTFRGMNTKRHLLIILGLLLLSALSAQAQAKFYLTYSGYSVSNGPSGIFVVHAVNNRTLLRQFADANSITNLRPLALMYHVKGNDLGDTIEIVDTSNSNVLATPFGLYFGEDQSLGRVGMTNSFGTQVRKIQYVYTQQDSHSLGDALLAEMFTANADGTTNGFIYGQMNYIIKPDGTQNLQVCNGTFYTIRRFQ